MLASNFSFYAMEIRHSYVQNSYLLSPICVLFLLDSMSPQQRVMAAEAPLQHSSVMTINFIS